MARSGSQQVSALEPTEQNPLLVRVRVERRVVATLARTRCDELKLRPGAAWTAALAARVAALAAQDAAREAAFKRLAKSSLSAKALHAALVRKGHGEAAATAAIAELQATGWLDDRAHAAARATALTKSTPVALEALAERLEGEGIEASLAARAARQAIDAAPMPIGQMLAREARAARKSGVGARTMASRLARRGFESDEVCAALRAAGYAVEEE